MGDVAHVGGAAEMTIFNDAVGREQVQRIAPKNVIQRSAACQGQIAGNCVNMGLCADGIAAGF